MENFNTTITLPESFVVTSRDQDVTVPLAALSADILAQAAMHGLRQVIGDAAAGAVAATYEAAHGSEKAKAATRADRKEFAEAHADDVAATTVSLMEKRLDTIKAGEWASRITGGRAEPLDPYRVQAMRKALDPNGKNGKMFGRLTSETEKRRFLLDMFADLDDDTQKTIDTQAEEYKRLADEKREQAKAFSRAVKL